VTYPVVYPDKVTLDGPPTHGPPPVPTLLFIDSYTDQGVRLLTTIDISVRWEVLNTP